jgi:CxC2 like cysteine cluster associated with KDZ transposases
MRESHKYAPFHRIEAWNGGYFRPASLWEVGTYLLVQHHDRDGLCDSLQFQKGFLDDQQNRNDDDEQTQLQSKRMETERRAGSGPGPRSKSTFYSDVDAGFPSNWGTDAQTEDHHVADDVDMIYNDDIQSDAAFEDGLNNSFLYNTSVDDLIDDDFDPDAAETDIRNVVEYLGPTKKSIVQVESTTGPYAQMSSDPVPESRPAPHSRPTPESRPDSGARQEPRPEADGLNNAYVRVLHTNGIHHIAMVTCSCLGQDKIALDLVACRLLPASFVRIRTIFTAQLMDYFRLCNLELKASAYQFYQLIRRLTLPMGQSEMVNLYHEFRRMSRLWRWMKKLKWAGYGHNQQDDHLNPPAGSLAIFCPTCPQPTVNLPEDWKMDANR